MIDLRPIKAELCEARQTDRAFCRIHRDELQALVSKAEEMAKIQNMVPLRVGYCDPSELHKLLQGELYRGGIQRKKKGRHTIEMTAMWLPGGSKKESAGIDLNSLAVVAET